MKPHDGKDREDAQSDLIDRSQTSTNARLVFNTICTPLGLHRPSLWCIRYDPHSSSQALRETTESANENSDSLTSPSGKGASAAFASSAQRTASARAFSVTE